MKISPAWCSTNPNFFPTCSVNAFLNSTFDFSEFNTAFDCKNRRSTPGIDGIDYDYLMRLPIKYKLILLDIYNAMFATNSYPDQ